MQSQNVSMPLAYASSLLKREPHITTTKTEGGGNRTRVRNCELVGDLTINGTTAAETAAYQLRYFDINPGLEVSFPWLSGTAKNYEFYKFHKFEAHFLPASKTDRDGLVTIGFDYDPRDPPPATEQELFVVPGSVQGPAYVPLRCKANPKALHNIDEHGEGLYVTKDPNGAEAGDPRLVFAGILYVATSGFVDGVATTIGRIVIDYDVSFTFPQSIDRSVTGGDFAKQRTVLPRLLPRVGKVYQDNPYKQLTFGVEDKVFDSARGAVQGVIDFVTGKKIDWRNLEQYWDAANSYFKIKDGGRVKLALNWLSRITKTQGSGFESAAEIITRLYKYVDGTATLMDVKRNQFSNTVASSLNSDTYNEVRMESILDVLPGDAFYWTVEPVNLVNSPNTYITSDGGIYEFPHLEMTALGL